MPSDRIESEDALIREFFVPLTSGFPGALGLQDDCALITPPPGEDLVVTTDAIVEGVHFLPDEDAGAIAWKAIAVNVSDLIAKGATPLAYVMSLSLPGRPERSFMSTFAAGLARAQEAFGCKLAGGDTDRTPGHFSVSITAFGTVPAGRMVRRASARAGDLIYVSGTIGDAVLGLNLRRDPNCASRWGIDTPVREILITRSQRPTPPVRLTGVLRTYASAAMDISDGLVKDFQRLCGASGTGGHIEAEKVPLSANARAVLAAGDVQLADLLTGGEDYEVLATVSTENASQFERSAAQEDVPVTCIGEIAVADAGISVADRGGHHLDLARTGWDHFRDTAE